MGKVMFTEENLRSRDAEPLLNQCLDPELIAQPGNHRFPENPVRAWKGLHAGEQQPLKLDEWLFKKSDIIEISSTDPAGFEAKIDRVLEKIVIVFFAGETLFLGRCDELSVL